MFKRMFLARLSRDVASGPALWVLGGLSALSVLSLNMFLPSLADIGKDFDVGYDLAGIAIAGYLAVTGVLQLIIGPLSDCYGRRVILLWILFIFACASLACYLASDIWLFLIFRMLQGVVVGAWSISMAIVRDTRTESEAASSIGYISMIMALAPMLGPVIGGSVADVLGWRMIFLLYSLFGVLLFIVVWLRVEETLKSPTLPLSLPSRDYGKLFRHRSYWGLNLAIAFATGTFYIFLAGVPLIAPLEFDLSVAEMGFYIGSITAGFMFGSYLSGRFSLHISPYKLFMVGRLLPLISLTAALLVYKFSGLSVFGVFGATLFVGIGNGLSMPGANALALSINNRVVATSASLIGATTLIVGAVLSYFISVVLYIIPSVWVLLLGMLLCVAFSLLIPVRYSGMHWK